MTRLSGLGILAVLAVGATTAGCRSAPVEAATPAIVSDKYCARLSTLDHYGARGQRLTTVGAIIRQDRANYFKPGRRDKEDQADHLLADRISREALEDRIDDTRIKLRDRKVIINGRPKVCVALKGEKVSIIVLDEAAR